MMEKEQHNMKSIVGKSYIICIHPKYLYVYTHKMCLLQKCSLSAGGMRVLPSKAAISGLIFGFNVTTIDSLTEWSLGFVVII